MIAQRRASTAEPSAAPWPARLACRERVDARLPVCRIASRVNERGFSLAEILLGAGVLAIVMAAILGAYVGQVTVSEHARNLTLATQDASRVIEEIRQNTVGCATPVADAQGEGGYGNDWDGWLENDGGGKSVEDATQNEEHVEVTCQDDTDDSVVACDTGAPSTPDPIRVTVTVCWRHRGRTFGECTTAGALAGADGNGNYPDNIANVVESPAMLTTLVTCR